jgi:hypothetical protein
MEKRHTFLDIPYEEHIVPFPNTAAMIMQHAREFPDRTVFRFTDKDYSYGRLLELCRTFCPDQTHFELSFGNIESELILMICLLFWGIPFELRFDGPPHPSPYHFSTTATDTEIPDVRLDSPAFTLDTRYCFSQYNMLAAAQGLGRSFHLFRPGDACCVLPLKSLTDLLFAVLAPLYFAKSIRFDCTDPAIKVFKGHAQYAWCKDRPPQAVPEAEISLLRDAAILYSGKAETAVNIPCAYYVSDADDAACGMAVIRDAEGRILPVPGCDILAQKDGSFLINGHVVGTER